MLILPPSSAAFETERRLRGRRAADRRMVAVSPPSVAADPDPIRRETADLEPEAASGPRLKPRGRNGGRPRSDRQSAGGDGPASRTRWKPHAPLVAQLIATALNLEQTRARRRGSAEDAAALYARKPEKAKPTRGEA